MFRDSWTASSQGTNLLLPVWAAMGASPSLRKLPGGIQVLDLAEKPRSRRRDAEVSCPISLQGLALHS